MGSDDPVKIFGHKVPDTDTVVSAIAYAWYYNNVKKIQAKPYVLGGLNKETKFVLDHFGVEIPETLEELEEGDRVVVVDTNNMDELPKGIEKAELLEIIDHHRLFGGLTTTAPVSITLRTMASTASLIYTVLNPEFHKLHKLPKEIAGIMLCALISDTLKFRSPTTTDEDREIGKELEKISGESIEKLAEEMFKAKSDISDVSPDDLIVMDSKVFDIKGEKTRVSVIETTDISSVIAVADELKKAMIKCIEENEDTDEMILFAIDILNENATPIVINDKTKQMVENAFNVSLDEGYGVKLTGIVSRKKQIIPSLLA